MKSITQVGTDTVQLILYNCTTETNPFKVNWKYTSGRNV
jgi:hypothetical protein